MKEWVVLSLQHQHFQSALKQLKEQYRTDPQKQTDQSTQCLKLLVSAKNSPTTIDELTDVALEKHPVYKEYQRCMGNEIDEDESDDAVNLDSDEESDSDQPAHRPAKKRVPKKCPLTMQAMNEPYETPCGHVFSKAGLLQYLKSNQGKCPTAGCTGKSVTKKSIKPVTEFEQDKAQSQFMEKMFGASQEY